MEESVGRFGGKLREVRGKRRVVRREAQGGTEESVGRYGGKHREVRRKASGGTEESARNYKERGGGYPSAFKKWVSAFAVLIMGTACEVAIKCGATGKEEVRRTGYLKSSIWGSEEIGRDKGGGKLGEAEAESAQLVAIAWGGVLHNPRRWLAMVGICSAELLKKKMSRRNLCFRFRRGGSRECSVGRSSVGRRAAQSTQRARDGRDM